MAIGGAYARSRVWFTRSDGTKPASVFTSRQRLRLRIQFTRVARSVLLEPSLAEQVARANASGRHAACDVRKCRNKTTESETQRSTRHAGHLRGSSLTLGEISMRFICLVLLLLLGTGCTRQPHYESRAKLLVRIIMDAGPVGDWPQLREKITDPKFVQSSLSSSPQLAASILKAHINVPSKSFVISLEVSGATPSASLEGTRMLVDAVRSAARATGQSFNVSNLEEAAPLK